MKKLAILGAGESGVGTAILAQKQGYTLGREPAYRVGNPFGN